MSTDSELATSQSSSKHTSQTLEEQEFTPKKRPQTPALASPPPTSSSKGKSKIEDIPMAHSDSDSCGICLSEDGKAVRGWIDSCDHYFCFVCIMEWSKVESRCPMCKRRFSSIRRPPKGGVFLSERIVNVPIRNQVYHYFGNSTMGPPDPYSQVKCSVCDGIHNENLLLLCDLCDSAAHTFCVGMGATVPEGDWFCQDCTLLKDEHAESEMDPEGHVSVSIIDIVREPKLNSLDRPIMISLGPSWRSSPVVTDGEVSVATGRASGTQPAGSATQSGARTLDRCRNVHGRIHALRENWNAYRSGSMSFPSSSVNRPHTGSVLCGGSSQPHLSSGSSQQLTAQKGSSSITLHDKSTNDIDKAWKMLNAAKSIGRGCGRTSTVHEAAKHPSREVNVTKDAGNTSTKLIASNSKKRVTSEDHVCFGSENRNQYSSLEKVSNNHKCRIFEKQKPTGVSVKGVTKLIEGFQTTCSPPSSRKDKTSVQVDIFHGNVRDPPKGNSVGAMLNVLVENDVPACSISPDRSVPAASNISRANRELHVSCQARHKKCRTENSCGDSKARSADNAKTEVQSLVKLNLKLLSGDKKLEVDLFKEVARLSTHSILAACGLECPKRGVHSFPSSVCYHADEGHQLRRSTLMPSSCRECFFVFVKDVVSTIMSEKLG